MLSNTSSLAENIRKNWETTVEEKKLQATFDCWQPVAFVIPDSEDTQIAQTAITDFLEIHQPDRVLLISGESGSGKSTLARYLANNPPQDYVPLYIELASIQDIDSDSFLNWVKKKAGGIDVTQGDVTGIHWLLILDGYDELKKDFKESNVYEKAELWRYDVTVMITSRPSAIPADSDARIARFSPSAEPPDEYSFPTPRPRQLYSHEIAPFTSGMQEAYLRQQWGNKSEAYLSIYHRLPSLKQLTERPFLLWLLSQQFPVILEKGNITEHSINLEQLKITQQALYDSFIESWLNKHYVRLVNKVQVSKVEWPQTEFLLDAKTYMNKLAYSLYRTGQTRFTVERPPPEIKNENKAPSETSQQKNEVKKSYGSVQSVFKSTSNVRQMPQITDTLNELRNPDGFFQRTPEDKPRPIAHLLAACLLMPLGEETYAFLHKSLLEHCTLDKLLNGIALSAAIGLGCNLNELSIVNDNDILQEAAKRMEGNTELQEILFEIVRSSRHEPNMAPAAANAITLLNRIGFNFSGKDLRRIRIKGANLHQALCDNTDFSEADLREVDFSQAWLRGAKFDKACLDDIEMGELPYLALSGLSETVCYSPQGQWLAVGEGSNIVLYDTTTHQKVREFTGHTYQVTSVTFNPAGNMVASASKDKTIRLWDTHSGQCLKTLEGHAGFVYSVSFHPTDNVLASASQDDTIRLWDIQSGLCLNTLKGRASQVTSVSFRPAGNVVASASWDNTIRLWDTQSGRCLKILEGHTGTVDSVSFHPDGNMVASAGDKTIRLWDTQSGDCLKILKGHTDNVRSVSFHPAGNMVASASWDNTIRLWDTQSGHCLNTLKGHTSNVASVSFHPDGKMVASASWDNTIRLWDSKKHQHQNTKQTHTDAVTSVTFNPAGNMIASASQDNTVRLWDARSGRCLNILKGHPNQVASVSFNPSGDVVTGAGRDGSIHLWNADSGDHLNTLEEHDERIDFVNCVSFAVSSGMIASAGRDGTIRLWNTQSGKCFNIPTGHSGGVASISFNPSGNMIASASWDNTIRLWDTQSGHCLNTLKGHASWVYRVSFHPAGNVLASVNSDNTIRLWDTQSGYCLSTLRGHTNHVASVTFNPAGNIVASASRDKTIRLWDSNTGNCLLILPLPYEVKSLAWNNESQLAVASGVMLSLWKIDLSSYQATLLWMSGPHGLMAKQLSLHQATGLLLPDKETHKKTVKSSAALLLEQHGYVGQLSSYDSEKVLEGRNEHYIVEKDIPIKPLLWKEGNILLTPNGSCVVSMVRSKRQDDNNQHVFLLIESVEQENEDSPALYRFRRAELFLDETAGHTERCGYLVEGKSCISLNDKSVFDIEMLIPDCEYRSFVLWPEQKQQLLTAIEKDIKQPPGYVLTGKGRLLSQGLTLFSSSQKRHNCLTWCEEKLSNLGFSKEIQQQKSWLDGFAAVSSWSLPPTEKLKIKTELPNYKCLIM